TVEASDASVAKERDPLTRRYTTDETLRLDITDKGRNKPWTLADDRHGAAHKLSIVGDSRPLIAVTVFLRDLPKPQGVVREVIVQLDQPRKHCASSVEHRYV